MTLTDIANIALEEIGANAIGNIDGNDVNARRIKRRIFLSIETMSKKRNWVCLRKDVELTRCIEKFFDDRYVFNIPNGLLNVISESAKWERFANGFLSREPRLRIFGTFLSYDPDTWNVNLTNAIIAQIKKDIAPQFVKPELIQNIFAISEQTIRDAMLSDAYDEHNKIIDKNPTWYSEI
jgi:hypothetical protein